MHGMQRRMKRGRGREDEGPRREAATVQPQSQPANSQPLQPPSVGVARLSDCDLISSTCLLSSHSHPHSPLPARSSSWSLVRRQCVWIASLRLRSASSSSVRPRGVASAWRSPAMRLIFSSIDTSENQVRKERKRGGQVNDQAEAEERQAGREAGRAGRRTAVASNSI